MAHQFATVAPPIVTIVVDGTRVDMRKISEPQYRPGELDDALASLDELSSVIGDFARVIEDSSPPLAAAAASSQSADNDITSGTATLGTAVKPTVKPVIAIGTGAAIGATLGGPLGLALGASVGSAIIAGGVGAAVGAGLGWTVSELGDKVLNMLKK